MYKRSIEAVEMSRDRERRGSTGLLGVQEIVGDSEAQGLLLRKGPPHHLIFFLSPSLSLIKGMDSLPLIFSPIFPEQISEP